jgi:hypothetical protein
MDQIKSDQDGTPNSLLLEPFVAVRPMDTVVGENDADHVAVTNEARIQAA